MSPVTALALRRLAVASGALAASLVAHCAATGDLVVTRSAPAVWAGLLAVATLAGRRRGWRPRGFGPALVRMGVAQALVHLAMSAAPWAFGLAGHHAAGIGLPPATLAAHAAAAVVLALLVTRLEAWLGRAVGLIRRLRRRLSDAGAAPAPRRVALPSPALVSRRPVGRLACRGPPRLRSA